MKALKDFDKARESARYTAGERLPIGAYVCKILNVKYVAGENGNSDRIDLLFDISEGDYQDFFKKQYDANTSEDKKWKGRTSVYIPKDDGSEKDNWTKNSFAKWVNGFEDSNDGYKWDWKEDKWKGLTIGIVFGETGTVIEGKEILYTEARFGTSAEKVRDGSAPKAKFKAKNGYTGNGNSSAPTDSDGFMTVEPGETDIPF